MVLEVASVAYLFFSGFLEVFCFLGPGPANEWFEKQVWFFCFLRFLVVLGAAFLVSLFFWFSWDRQRFEIQLQGSTWAIS